MSCIENTQSHTQFVKSLCLTHFAHVFSVASLTEKESLVKSLQEELSEVREKLTIDGVRLYLHPNTHKVRLLLLLVITLPTLSSVFVTGPSGPADIISN